MASHNQNGGRPALGPGRGRDSAVVMYRVDRAMFEVAAVQAAKEGKSVNAYARAVLSRHLGRTAPRKLVRKLYGG